MFRYKAFIKHQKKNMRKTSTYLLAILFIVAILFSCTKDEFSPFEWGVEPHLRIHPLAVILTPNHPCDTVKIETNYKNFQVSSSSWINIKKIKGFPALIVSAQAIKGNQNKREEYVTVTVSRGTKHQLSQFFVVIQYKENAPFK